MKHLGIDYGSQRVGLAVSDPSGTLAFPCKTLYIRSQKQLVTDIQALVAELNIETVVIGLPLHPPDEHGEEPLSLRQARNVAARLARRLEIPVVTVDETLSSVAAREDLAHVARLDSKRRQGIVDQQAAVRILQQYLETRSRTSAPVASPVAPPTNGD